jgi:hypothetical protein
MAVVAAVVLVSIQAPILVASAGLAAQERNTL